MMFIWILYVAMIFGAETISLEALSQRMRVQETVHCQFAQNKRSSLFRQELKSKGEFWVMGKDKLRFETKTPATSTLLIVGQRVVMRTSNDQQEMPIAQLPQAERLIHVFSESFTGHLLSLQTLFTAHATMEGKGTAAHARVLLKPQTNLNTVLQQIELEFASQPLQLTRLRYVEANGDETELRLSACVPQVDDSVFVIH